MTVDPRLLYLALLTKLAVKDDSIKINRRLKETRALLTLEQMCEIANAIAAAGETDA